MKTILIRFKPESETALSSRIMIYLNASLIYHGTFEADTPVLITREELGADILVAVIGAVETLALSTVSSRAKLSRLPTRHSTAPSSFVSRNVTRASCLLKRCTGIADFLTLSCMIPSSRLAEASIIKSFGPIQ
jgi:hypothetical protein